MVRCNVCSTMDRKERVMQPKWDTLKKHGSRRKAFVNMRIKQYCTNSRMSLTFQKCTSRIILVG